MTRIQRRSSYAAAITTTSLMLLAQGAAAHDTFLLPATWTTPPGTPLALQLTSGSSFPALDSGPTPDRIVALGGQVLTSDGRAPVSLRVSGHSSSALQPRLSAAGAGEVTAGLSLAPRDIDLQPDSVEHYFEEIRPSAGVREAWAAQEHPVLRETYAKHAKVLLCATPCAPDDGKRAPVALGHPLEFLPLGSPNEDGRRFRLLANGQPAIDHPLNVWTADGEHAALRTNSSGEVSVRLEVAGPAMLSAVNLRPPTASDKRFQSDFATLTLLVP
ncbi:MAG: DUF4198 domain-containing protein [Pseudomonadota bacterium]